MWLILVERERKLKVLMFSLDRDMISRDCVGDTLERLQGYVRYLEELWMLVPTLDPKLKDVEYYEGNIHVSAVYGRNSFIAYYNILSKARRLCREQGINLITTQDAVLGFVALLLRRELGLKVFVNVFGLPIFQPTWIRARFLNRFLKPLYGFTLRHADLIRTDNSMDAGLMMDRLGVQKERIVIIPVVPEKKALLRLLEGEESYREELLENKFEHIVLFVGMLIEQKDIPNLVEASRNILKGEPRSRFVIIGDGPEREMIEDLCSEYSVQGNFLFKGIVPYDRLPAYYRACDLLVLPSLYEGFPRVLMEAGLAGKPIVSTDVGAAHDIIENRKTGFVVPPGDSNALAEGCITILRNPEKAIIMGELQRKRILEYCDYQTNLDRLIISWQELVGGERPYTFS